MNQFLTWSPGSSWAAVSAVAVCSARRSLAPPNCRQLIGAHLREDINEMNKGAMDDFEEKEANVT